MSRLRRELEADFHRLAEDGYCADPVALAREGLRLLTPPERISITECAAQSRLIPNAEGGLRLWSPTMAPYINGVQDAMDDPLVRSVAVVGPARSGKTVGAENTLFKRMLYGPSTDVLWFTPAALIDDYLNTTVAGLFENHPEISSKVGDGKSDNNKNSKKVGGKFIRWLPAQPAKIVGKQAPLIVADEIDIYPKQLRRTIRLAIAQRQRAFGNIGKSYLCSHPDAGWGVGIASIWQESNKGVWFWGCPHCDQYSSPCPTADWRMKLDFERPKGMAADDAMDHAEQTACMICPHCGGVITNDSKPDMLASGKWVFEGQTIGLDGTLTGAPKANPTWGFWIHGTMSPFVSWGTLAREIAGAQIAYETTGNTDLLKEVTSKSLGEVYEGPSGRRVDLKRLKERMKDDADAETADDEFRVGEVPPWVRFITAAADVGGNKFDTAFWGWGADAECALIQRETLTATASGAKLQPPLRQEHWNVLVDRVLNRRFPIKGRPGWTLGVATMLYDTGGAPGTAWQAREFTRRMMTGPCRGALAYRCRPIKGAASKKAPEIGTPREVNKDDKGKPIEPPIYETDLGVHALKLTATERLAIDAPGPGFIHLPRGGDPKWAEELTNESLIDDEWVRRGDNETWDLYVYGEAGRLMLKPDRKEIDWSRPPPWAQPQQTAERPKIEPAAAATVAATPEQTKAARRQKLIERISR